jgi:hypothetical protein
MQTVPGSGTSCNGVYSGTFNGSTRVAAGQSCVFINGGQITGDVNVEGHLGLIDAMARRVSARSESQFAQDSSQKLYTLSKLDHFRALALLGEPGVGKSAALRAQYNALERQRRRMPAF